MAREDGYFTSETGRENQIKAKEKQAKNKAERETFAALLEVVLAETITTKDGEEISKKMSITRSMAKKARTGDVQAVKWIADMLGETPAAKSNVDVTSGGKAIEAVTGMVVLPPDYHKDE